MDYLRNYIIKRNIELTELEKSLIKNEGVSYAYYHINNILHFGIGHNCKANEITEKQNLIIQFTDKDLKAKLMLQLLREDIEEAKKGLRKIINVKLTAKQYDSLTEMIFQMGIGSFREFKKTIAYINNLEWDKATIEACDSEWFREHTDRAKEVVLGFLN